MCIALPVRIAAVLDGKDLRVAVEGPAGREEANAALFAEDEQGCNALLGRWAVVHAGFVLSLMDEEEARSRLAVFDAMDGLPVADGLLHPNE